MPGKLSSSSAVFLHFSFLSRSLHPCLRPQGLHLSLQDPDEAPPESLPLLPLADSLLWAALRQLARNPCPGEEGAGRAWRGAAGKAPAVAAAARARPATLGSGGGPALPFPAPASGEERRAQGCLDARGDSALRECAATSTPSLLRRLSDHGPRLMPGPVTAGDPVSPSVASQSR